MRDILKNKKGDSRSYFESQKNVLKSKRSAEMALGTIVVIILALVVLIFVIFGFTSGWNNIWQKILNFGGGGSNVATVVQACQAACATNDGYNYCALSRTLSLDDKKSIKGSCKSFETQNVGMAPCSIDCTAFKITTCSGTWKTACDSKTETDQTSSVQDSSGNDINAMKCCVVQTAATK